MEYQPEFEVLHPSFRDILGHAPTTRLVVGSDDGPALYHEACIYDVQTRSVFVTSNQLLSSDPQHKTIGKHIKLSQISISPKDSSSASANTGGTEAQVVDITPPTLQNSFLNGGVNYDEDSILLCAQGSMEDHIASGLVLMSMRSPYTATVLVPDFHSIPFNSVNDVVIHPMDKSIWFTDPCYGHSQGFRNTPQLPNQVYRFDPVTNSIRAIADGFTRPNGLCFSPDLTTLYVTDTGLLHGAAHIPINLSGPSHIYAFDIVQVSNQPFLSNRRLFAYAPGRAPDGIKCDTEGNVYAGCMNGLAVWNSGGVPIGNIKVKGGVANFCFGENGQVFLCNETKFWSIQLNSEKVRGALLGL